MITSFQKFIVDLGVGRSIEKWLTSQNYVVLSIALINPEMQDNLILELANNEDAIIISMDKDFGELVFKNFLPHKGNFVIEIRGCNQLRKTCCYSKYSST
jgi:predicted nuclease of predicted toxin-antitoxin system